MRKNSGVAADHHPARVDAGAARVADQRAQHLGDAAAVRGRVDVPERPPVEQLAPAGDRVLEVRQALGREDVAEALGVERRDGDVLERHGRDPTRRADRQAARDRRPTSTSSSVVTTRSAPAAASSSASSARAIAERRHAAGLGGLDARRRRPRPRSTARGATPSSCAAVRKISGSRLAVREVAPGDVGVEEVEQRQAGPDEVEEMPCCSANVSSRIWRRNSPAFFDDDAAATADPGVLDRDDEAQRVGVGGEVARFDEPTTISCLRWA